MFKFIKSKLISKKSLSIVDAVRNIRLFAIGAMNNFMEKYPSLVNILSKSKHPSSDWDFYMTVAGAGLVLLNIKPSRELFENFLNEVVDIDRQIPDALNNFLDFVKKYVNNDNFLHYVGVWVLWNIGGKQPSFQECEKLAPAIGNYLGVLVTELTSK